MESESDNAAIYIKWEVKEHAFGKWVVTPDLCSTRFMLHCDPEVS